ncbi:MAG TPA: hypothetical protein VH092_35580 [Urbifossiella sp.]|jgi:hypothetical protein|nr:hypothetical protein [Urbifossiella sp.]
MLETVFEQADGKRLVVTLLCRGGFEGERIDDDAPRRRCGWPRD